MKKNHLEEGIRQAYLDGQLPASEQEQVKAHLAHCAGCSELLQVQTARAAVVQRHLDCLPRNAKPLSISQAQVRFQQYSRHKEVENQKMKNLLFGRYRTAWMAATLVLILAVALAFPPVRAIANSFLGLFRVQQITLVQVSNELPEQLSQSTQMEMLFSENVQFSQQGESQVVGSAAEASELAGFTVRQPTGTTDVVEFNVTPSGQVKFTVDREKLHAILDEMDRSDLRLPQAVDGAEVLAEIQAGVSISFGPCIEVQGDPDDPDSHYYRECTTFLQIPSPIVEAPAGLDVRRIGEVYMQFLGMSAEDAQAFSQNVDWANTLVIPIPADGMAYQQVAVDGVIGTFLSPSSPDAWQTYLLFWVKDGLVYAMNGEGGLAEALEIVNSLK